MDKTTLVVASLPKAGGRDALIAYVRGVIPLFRDIGGVVIKRSQYEDIYLGTHFFMHLLIMDFPSKQALVDLFESEEYKQFIPLRDQAFEKINICYANDMV